MPHRVRRTPRQAAKTTPSHPSRASSASSRCHAGSSPCGAAPGGHVWSLQFARRRASSTANAAAAWTACLVVCSDMYPTFTVVTPQSHGVLAGGEPSHDSREQALIKSEALLQRDMIRPAVLVPYGQHECRRTQDRYVAESWAAAIGVDVPTIPARLLSASHDGRGVPRQGGKQRRQPVTVKRSHKILVTLLPAAWLCITQRSAATEVERLHAGLEPLRR